MYSKFYMDSCCKSPITTFLLWSWGINASFLYYGSKSALYHQYVYITTSLQDVHYSDRACEGAWLWWSEQVRGIEDMLAGHGLRYVLYGLRLDFLLWWICSFVIGVEDVHVGQSVPGSQGENSWPGLHILGIINIIISIITIITHSWLDKDIDKDKD